MDSFLTTDGDHATAEGRGHGERAQNHCEQSDVDGGLLGEEEQPGRDCSTCLLTILGYSMIAGMAHTSRDKEKLLVRVRRIRGQVEAIERALESEQECADVLQLMAACRGALNGLMAEIMEGHIRFHVLSADNGKNSPQVQAAEELIDIIRAYLK